MATTGLFAQKGLQEPACTSYFDVQPIRPGEPERMHCPHWLLALTIPFSRSDRAHTYSPVLMPGARRTVPDKKLSPESLLRLSEGRGAVPTGVSHYQTRLRASTRPNRPNSAGSTPLNRPTTSILPVSTGLKGDPAPLRGRLSATPIGGMRRTTIRPSACHPGVRGPTGFPSSALRRGPPERTCAAR